MTIPKDEIKELRAKAGTYRVAWPDPDVDPDADEVLSFPWRSDDGRVSLTLEQCNAVRCAAHDDLPYSEIAELFSFLSCKRHAQNHATGQCSHSGGVARVTDKRPAGPAAGVVTPGICTQLRRKWDRGRFDTYEDAGEWANIEKSAAWKHINGECSHD